MKNKVYSIISTLSSTELEKLSRFLRFAYSGKATLYINLITEYSKLSPEVVHRSKEPIFCRLFPGKPYKDVKLRLLQSEVTKAIEHYFAYESLNEDDYYYQNVVLENYRERRLDDIFQHTLASEARRVISEDQLSGKHLEYKVLIAQKRYEVAMRHRKMGRKETEDLQQSMDREYIVKKLRTACLIASQEKVYNVSFDHGLRDVILAYVEERCLYEDPAVGLYYYCFKMLDQQRDFQEFRSYLDSYGKRLSEEENKELFNLAINFCIRSLNKGNKDFGAEGLRFYEDGIRKGILLNNAKISRFTFRNMITMAIRLEDYKRAERYMNEYHEMLDPTYKKDTMSFMAAMIYFSKGDFQRAMSEIYSVNFRDLLLSIAAKALQVKIYYEIGEMYLLSSHLDAMQIYLKRHKSLGYHKENYMKMIKFAKRLIKANTEYKLGKLAHELNAENTLIDKSWFIEKVQESKVKNPSQMTDTV